jgi:ParB-like chromosome segregation protein Spo0J
MSNIKNKIGILILTTAVLDNAEAEVEIRETKRADLSKVDPRNIAPNPNNHRQINVEDADMQELIASIRANGVITPLMLKPNPNFGIDGEKREFVSYAGNRRITAVMAIINDTENPMDIQYVPAQIKKHVTLDTEYLTQIIENSGKPFTFLEKAEVISQLVNVCGWTPAEVEAKTGEPQSMISNFLTVTGWTKKHKKMISDNDISAQLALRIARESETTEEFDSKMEELFEAAQNIKATGQHKAGSKRAVITEKNAGVIVEKNARKILEKVWLKLEKEGVKGKHVDLLMDITTELKKPTKLTVSKICKLFAN